MVLQLVAEQIQFISLQDGEQNWDSIKLKSQQLFIQTIERQTIKFNYRKVFVPYGMAKNFGGGQLWKIWQNKHHSPMIH